MKTTTREHLRELHTWAGIVFAGLLFAIFWTGTLSVFDKEIDQWMMPMNRLPAERIQVDISIDKQIRPILDQQASDAAAWTILLPRERIPFLTLAYGKEDDRKGQRINYDPLTMELLPPSYSDGASNFFYPFHHNLTLRHNDIGAWIVGIASMGMLCLLISGVIIHRRIFTEFFTFRAKAKFGRSNLDLHNLTGVLPMPFYILITLSGLMIAFMIYFPNAYQGLYNDRQSQSSSQLPRVQTAERQFLTESLGRKRLPKANMSAEIGSLDAMVKDAEKQWGDNTVYLVRVNYPYDAKGNVVLRRTNDETITKNIDNYRYDAPSAAFIERYQSSATVNVWNFISGLHYIQFKHWTLRWLYFLGGLAGCICIATGLFFFVEKRWNKHQKQNIAGSRLVDAMAVTSITGIFVATAMMMLLNRLIPETFESKAQMEQYGFWGIWVVMAFHAFSRQFYQNERISAAWHQQLFLMAALSFLCVLLNGLTTGDHLIKTLFWSPDMAVAGVDLVMLVMALIGVKAGLKLRNRQSFRSLNIITEA